jgi:hypothetical protein
MGGPPVPDDRRRILLCAALAFLQLPPRAPELRLLHRWLDNWRGVGALAVGLHRVGYDLTLIQQGDVRAGRPSRSEPCAGSSP